MVAHESSAGTRVIHAYPDPASEAANGIRASSMPATSGRVKVTLTNDPGWERVRHLRS